MYFEGGLGLIEVDKEEGKAFAWFLDEGEWGGACKEDHFVGDLSGGDPAMDRLDI